MNPQPKSNRGLRILLGTLLVLIVAFVILVRVTFDTKAEGRSLTLDALRRLAAQDQIVEATLLDEDAQVVGRYCPTGPVSRQGATASCPGPERAFHVAYPRSDVVTQAIIAEVGESAPVTVDRQGDKAVGKLLVTFVMPLLLLANLFGLIFVSRSSDSSLADVAGFGRLNRRRQREKASDTAVTFADVAGAGTAVTELSEVIEYLRDPTRFQAMGATAPRGVLLFGPPGCGKTLLARAVAGESGVPFISVSGTEFVESLVGVGAARVRDLFAQVRELAPAICFVDEIDALGRRREGEGVSGGEREQTLNQLLVEMDGFDVSSGVVVIGATNRPDILDPALMRPGRFDRHITLEPPDAEGRRAILEVHARSRPMAPDVDLALVAARTPGFTGADLANVLNEAALLTVRAGVPGAHIGRAQVSEAISRVLHGPHQGTILSPAERTRIATHEAGHALVATAVGHGAEVHRVSVVARGRGLGTTAVTVGGDRALLTEQELADQLAMAVAGVAAEATTLGSISTTAEDDVERATALARQMVGLYGMSPTVGRVRVLNRALGYLGEGGVSFDAVSAQTVAAFDAEVRHLIAAAEARAGDILAANRPHLEALVARLAAEETLEGDDLAALLAPVAPAPDAAGNGSAARRGRAGAEATRTASTGTPEVDER